MSSLSPARQHRTTHLTAQARARSIEFDRCTGTPQKGAAAQPRRGRVDALRAPPPGTTFPPRIVSRVRHCTTCSSVAKPFGKNGGRPALAAGPAGIGLPLRNCARGRAMTPSASRRRSEGCNAHERADFGTGLRQKQAANPKNENRPTAETDRPPERLIQPHDRPPRRKKRPPRQPEWPPRTKNGRHTHDEIRQTTPGVPPAESWHKNGLRGTARRAREKKHRKKAD